MARTNDPQATGDEGPVHAVTLSPFFLSKHELEPRADPVARPAKNAPATRHFRGGGFWDKALFARSASRGMSNLDSAQFWLGLRPARELQEPPAF